MCSFVCSIAFIVSDINELALLRWSWAVLSQRLGLGKGGLRMAPEEALGELLQVCLFLGYLNLCVCLLTVIKMCKLRYRKSLRCMVSYLCLGLSNSVLAYNIYIYIFLFNIRLVSFFIPAHHIVYKRISNSYWRIH